MPAENQDLVSFTVEGENGATHTFKVPRSAVLDTVKDTHVPKDRVSADIDRRVRSIIENQGLKKADELLADDAFVQRVAEQHGLVKKGSEANSASAEAAAQQIRDALARQRAEIEQREIKPRDEKLTLAEQREERRLSRQLDRDLNIALRDAGVKKALLPAVVGMLRDRFGYDDEADDFFVEDPKTGDPMISSGSGKNTYKDINEFVQEFVEQSENAEYLDRQTQGGPGVSGSRRPGGEAGTVTLTAEQASDASVYNQALQKVGGDHSKVKILRPASPTF